MNTRERKFNTKMEELGKYLIFEPIRFRLKAGDTYKPDFYCPKDNEYIELAGTRQAFHKSKEKYQRFQKEYPFIKFRVVHLDFSGNEKKLELSKLSDYLDKTKQTQNDFAIRLGKSQQLVSGYCTGAFIPPRATALKIVEITKGAVTLSDLWHTKFA
jgi:hypothetical protein